MLQPGDIVRLLHESGEGVVIRMLPNSRATVRIDGFETEVALSNLVQVAASAHKQPEKVYFQDNSIAPVGLCISLEVEDSLVLPHILNETPDVLLLSVVAGVNLGYQHVLSSILQPFGRITMPALNIQDFGENPTWIIRWMAHPPDLSRNLEDGYAELKLKEAHLRKTPKPTVTTCNPTIIIPILNERNTISNQHVKEEEWKEQKWKKNLQKSLDGVVPIPPDVIDLHAHKLPETIQSQLKRSNSSPLSYQLRYFCESIEAAFVHGIPSSMTVVHGKGEGVLKKEVETLLKQYRTQKIIREFYTDWFNAGQTRIYFEKKGF